jgi:hypothetical protein
MSIAMATIVLVSLCAVCASTSVSAAPSSSANAETSAGLVGAPAGVVGAPAVCSDAANSIHLFVRGTDNALYYRHEASGAWGQWVSLGGRLTSSPSAASYQFGVFVCARGGDGAFWYKTGDGENWGAWYTRGGRLLEGTGPAAFSYGGGVLFAVIGMDHQLYRWAPGWASLGGYLTSSPAAKSPVPNVIVIAARGGDGALWRASTSNNFASWSWTSLGGLLLEGTGPGVADAFFVTGTNHALFWWSGSTWVSLGGYLTSSPGATEMNRGLGYPDEMHVFVRGGDGNLWEKYYGDYPNPGWSAWTESAV